ncbi:hydroxyacid dehydrogenase [Actinoplanes sp. LDG1-06]|uniref:Hydroxyacid dehydrogenase n=1 Tax=Paractinoplanes ovalisporus TaxID=2810368 RepID=A0ABS2AF32_9ACTN|nr:NAD(P)-dependent oxidoreductase [Actinoplanes ovalisporus]MBM2618445.1 hydroxyacid dehydrogenase [Actinoplanes ovalisporus]
MRIIYLDEPTYFPEPWRRRFERLGELEVFTDRPDAGTAVDRLSASDIAIVEWTHLPAGVFERVRRLRHLALVTTGYDFVDLDAARSAGIAVSHCPAYAAQATAEHVFALLLAVTRRLRAADEAVRAGAGHLYPPFLGMELAGRTLGLIGKGRIARSVARIADGFGMTVLSTDSVGQPVSLTEVLRRSDVVSVHVPFGPATRHLLDAGRLALLRDEAILINTCRGGIIDQAALARMLADGRLAGAGLDDLSAEAADDIRGLDNVVLSPGTAWYTGTAREANLVELHDNLTSYLDGRPINILN